MTRSHVLLHCPNTKIRAARVEAWEGKGPGCVRVLLSNPRWEKRLLRFLELSGVGRVMDDGVDEEGAGAGRLDRWILWETEEWGREHQTDYLFLLFFPWCLFRRTRTPSFAHSAPMGA
jgi:hypothetical protein